MTVSPFRNNGPLIAFWNHSGPFFSAYDIIFFSIAAAGFPDGHKKAGQGCRQDSHHIAVASGLITC